MWAKASNTETESRVFPEAENLRKIYAVVFKGFLKVGTAPAISIA
jgi:hypothetical protein